MTIDYDPRNIENILGLTAKRRKKLIRYYSSLAEPVRIEAHRLQRDCMRQYREAYRGTVTQEEFSYAMLLLALDKMLSIEEFERQRNVTSEHADKAAKLRAARIKASRRVQKPSPTKERILLRYFKLICRLREEEKMSWREIARYIKKHHHEEISHVYLKKVCEEKKRSLSGAG
ncbi:hypothetical protein KVP06_10660 [Geobacter sulfurreducens]|uniref:Uncharacterized protein n=1 Tax=Geobacter sulfurreducens (strain ATCC 51573 / DSM 12127 / PCA) TaxID=243231 RepID=Q74BC6_GEOSL|nr:hypothetical protein [Geobacter sulfurreducens]AAR35491.1 hypothetical protein GSU2115 [Geobacter sulfurreducens PCA]UAC02841.1 hypothetical protein KVP06_10660 [Geobacter sulfurreducens]HCD97604.1 hypothetical protein [Geobacter sulfurreducens]